MRTLFLTNYYPPFSRGGYEQWCREVAVELTRRGHQVQVLTSRVSGKTGDESDTDVSIARRLSLEVEGGLFETIQRLVKDRKPLEARNLRNVQQLITDFRPDVALIWGMWNVPRSVPALVEELLPGRVAYYLCDYWLSLPNAYIQRWQADSSRALTKLPKQILSKAFLTHLTKEAPIELALEHPLCVSRAVRQLLVDAGVPIEHAQVIYGGTQIEQFTTVANIHNNLKDSPNRLKLLYVGRLDTEKGVFTALQALALMVDQTKLAVTLDIVGQGHFDYETKLMEFVKQNQLEQLVHFQGQVPRSEIPAVLAQYDALVFPSEWEEPFARTVLEAMAANLVVIGTTTGGTGEILIEGKTGLTFPAGDPQTLADQIQRLLRSPALKQKLARAGQQAVVENFTFDRMVNEIESTLTHIYKREEVSE